MKHPLSSLVVVLPGVMGSELRDRDGRTVWGTSMGTVVKGVLTRGRAIKRLRLPDGIGDDPAPDGVVATRLLPDIHVIPGIWSVSIGYDRLNAWFRDRFDVISDVAHGGGAATDAPAPNFVEFPYDWRLSNRVNAVALKQRVEPLLERFRSQPGREDAKVVFVGHSMGGLVARYYVDVLGGHEVTAKVVTLGTPHRGALNALDNLVNGVSKGLGPLRIDLTEAARSFPSLYQLLPEYACIESAGGLLKTTESQLPELRGADVADAMHFHEELRSGADAFSAGYDAHPLVSHAHPTATTARITGGAVEKLATFEGRHDGGDGTVPRLSATPYGVSPDSPTIRYVGQTHGALPADDPVLTELEGVLTARRQVPRVGVIDIGVECDDLVVAGVPIETNITAESGLVVDASLHADNGAVVATAAAVDRGDDTYEARFADIAPGCYLARVGVRGVKNDVSVPLAVLPPAADLVADDEPGASS